MREIARIDAKDREALFRNTAHMIGLNEAIVEKDFWVCWMLDYLFNRCPWKKSLIFKGGTSLSKAYGLIDRFSEDIDLVLDWRVLGYGVNEPWEQRSNTKQDSFNKEANKRAEIFLYDEFMSPIRKELSEELGSLAEIYIDAYDPQTVKFKYPRRFSDDSVLQEIRLEIGALAAWTPASTQIIMPYAAEQYRQLFIQPKTSILTVLPERTFWEKVTILHREANRSESKEFPTRYSRHYYDLYRMKHSSVKEDAFANLKLLENVAVFKDKFYHCPWAKYEEAKQGTIKLMPPKHNIDKLELDYQHMANMLYGTIPSFQELMGEIKELEVEINAL